MNAVKMPADRIRYDGWKIDTGVSSSPSSAPCPTEKSSTASSTRLDTATRRAASRPTYSTIPKGIANPPTDTAKGSSDASTAASSTSAKNGRAKLVTPDTNTHH